MPWASSWASWSTWAGTGASSASSSTTAFASSSGARRRSRPSCSSPSAARSSSRPTSGSSGRSAPAPWSGIATLVLALSTTDTADAERHGGLAGSYARIVLTDLVGSVGVSIVVVLGALAALVLITGASVGLLMRSSGRRVARAAEAGARLSGEVGRRVRERPAGRPSLRALPTPPAGNPPLDGSQEFADLYGEIPELSEPPALQIRARVAGRGPARAAGGRGRRRRGDPGHRGHAAARGTAHSVPPAAREHPRPHEGRGRCRAGSRARRPHPHRCPGQLRRRGPRRRQGDRPARDALRAPARRRDEGEPRLPASRRPGIRARDHRDPHPRADPRQAGRGRRGAEHARPTS